MTSHSNPISAGALLTIDLDAICDNWRTLKEKVGRAECAAVVKADAYGLGARGSWQLLEEQARQFRPRFVALTDPDSADCVDGRLRGLGVEVLRGPDGLVRMAQDPETDRVLSAIVGAAGLQGTWAALEAGKTVALANKETLVVAGPLITALARRTGADLLPVDSEHSAIAQALRSGAPQCRNAR